MNDSSPSSSDNKLDWLLQKWSQEQQPSTEQLDSLCQRVQASLAASTDHDLSSPITKPNAPFALRAAVSGLALAASLLVCVTCYQLIKVQPPSHERTSDSNNNRHRMVVADFTNQKQLMEKLQAIYDQPLLWIAETGDKLQVEVDDPSTLDATASSDPWLLIRLAVERQSSSNADNSYSEKPLWQIDLVVRNEQTVRLTGTSNQSEQLQVWPCLTQDGLVMVDTQYESLGPVKTKSNQTNLMRTGSRTRLNSLDDEYALWQYVEVVEAKL